MLCNRRVKIALVTLSMGQGGIENLILSLLDQFKSFEHDVEVLCLDEGGELLDEVVRRGGAVKVFSRMPGLDVKLVRELTGHLRNGGFHVVHTHNQASHFYGCIAAKLAGVPVVVNTEHSRHYISGYWRRRLEKWVLSLLSDRMVAVSEELALASVKLDYVSAHKTCVVQNGVDITRFSSITEERVFALREYLKIPKNAQVVTIVARLHPIKNHLLLFDAIKRLNDGKSDLFLLVVGDGEMRHELQREVVRLDLTGRILFLGSRSDIPELMAASDVLVLCSKSEGLPLVVLEGMASGTPFVVTDGANGAGLIEHGKNGLVCRNNAADLADALFAVLSGTLDISSIIDTAQRNVASQYSIQATASQYVEIYQEILAGKIPPDLHQENLSHTGAVRR